MEIYARENRNKESVHVGYINLIQEEMEEQMSGISKN